MYKQHYIASLLERRSLEKELARLKYPELYCSSLDVVAELSTSGPPLRARPDSVSVLISNYNYSQYVRHAIDSVFAQTHSNVELLVIDDASRDSSPELLRSRLEGIGPIPSRSVFLKHNIGLPAVRNLGVRLARGHYVFILDADNYLAPECLRLHVRLAESTGAEAVYAVVQIVGDTPTFLSDAPWNVSSLARQSYIDAMALFARPSLLDCGIYTTDPILYGWEDYELWLRFASQRRKVEFIPTPLSFYRCHDDNMIRITNLDTRAAWLHLFKKYPDLFKIPEGDLESEAARRAAFDG